MEGDIILIIFGALGVLTEGTLDIELVGRDDIGSIAPVCWDCIRTGELVNAPVDRG
jgi:hypothetical protein